MCDMCDDPSLTPADVRGRLAAMIARRGWALQFVEAEGHHRSLTYTMGLTDFQLPELVAHGPGPTRWPTSSTRLPRTASKA